MSPPKCPVCGLELWRVSETIEDTYRWNSLTGEYDLIPGWLQTHCTECGADVAELFGCMGACNYKKVQ